MHRKNDGLGSRTKDLSIRLDLLQDQNPIICDFGLAVQVGNKLQQATPEYADTAFIGMLSNRTMNQYFINEN